MTILYWIFFGLIVGILAKWIVPGAGPGGALGDIIVGIIGGFIGGWLFNQFGHPVTVGFTIPGMICAVIGAVILLFVLRAVSGRRAV
jgi:uncharacterized membrane protein YeaQ/YmgE (transglycosylase-associated protein family)